MTWLNTACKLCGSALPSPGSKRRYCSEKCAWRAQRERNQDRIKESAREYRNRPEIRERERRRKRPGTRPWSYYIVKPPKYAFSAGMRIGLLVVLGTAPIISGRFVAVQCDCGSEPFVIRSSELRRKRYCSLECSFRARRGAGLLARSVVRASPRLVCRACGSTKARRDFSPSQLRWGKRLCRACCRVAQNADFQRQKNALTSNYVKKQIAKHTRLKMRDIPRELVEAKRVQLQITRLLSERNEAHG